MGPDDSETGSFRFNVDQVIETLNDDGVDVVQAVRETVASEGGDASDGRYEQLLGAYFATTQTVTYKHGVPVVVEVPAADELMDASNITQKGQKDPDLCAAAG